MSATQDALLRVRGLSVSVAAPNGRLRILDDVSLSISKGRALGVVGESGSGKSLLALAVLGLLPAGARVDAGAILLLEDDLIKQSETELCKVRGGKIGMMFQEPALAFDPVYTVGAHISEAIRLHAAVSRSEAHKRAVAWLSRVGLADPAAIAKGFPHELSGGMRQRAMLAVALAAGPMLLLADEPTTMLDRTLEAQILRLIGDLQQEHGLGVLFVSHDLAVIAESTEDLVILYAGQVVERGPTAALLAEPQHPYTRALIDTILRPGRRPARKLGAPTTRLSVLGGSPPAFDDLPAGCRFAPRCSQRMPRCDESVPELLEAPGADGRGVRCFLFQPEVP